LKEKVIGFGNCNKELEELVRTLMESSCRVKMKKLEVELVEYKKMVNGESKLSILK